LSCQTRQLYKMLKRPPNPAWIEAIVTPDKYRAKFMLHFRIRRLAESVG